MLLIIPILISVYCLYCKRKKKEKDSVLGELNITQYPKILNTSSGDKAKISCDWSTEDVQQIRVQWKKYISIVGDDNGTVLCSVLRTVQSNNSEKSNNKITCNVVNNTALLTIDGVTKDDHGLYFCEVIIEIPELAKATGNGTQLNVQDDIRVSGVLKYVSAFVVIAMFTFVALTAYFLWKQKKKLTKKIQQKRKQEEVELNQVHQEEAEAEEESSSTNSITWAESTLYESFDYFAMKNPIKKAAASSTDNLVKPQTMEESPLTAL
ncbi:transmembrane and immunoglobulin domain-containing protein 2 isoform X2 [Rhinoderma darwinii]|uniref:transmembrane and immunoglobulin domain-containing protein 2 isoform X2 n=1 Tax=Rhinoderma darwinii TaxID=43563 RepID=UPI003F66687C